MSQPVNGRPALSDEVKKRLKPLIIELRRTLEEDLERELRRLGFDGSKDSPVPVEKLSYLTDQERAIRAELEAILAKEQESIGSFAGALEAVRREAAYTHLNRLVGLKCLELRGHLVIEGERTEAVTCRAEFGGRSKWLWTLRSRESRYRHGAQAEELLWREGLLQACATVTEEIGVLFDPADPYAQVWPSFRTLRMVVDRLNELPEDAFRTDELLGWVYQYFQTEEKEKVTAGESFTQKLKKTKKYTGPDIATYTALYTERYMVDFLLQNSIGAYWMEMYPDSPAKEAWPYYVTPATPHTRLPKPLKEWKLLDPAMGSGHFLVVAFDLLAQLYKEERQMEADGRLPAGWSVPAEQTARVILENNLHGIDIDLRAVQLAALALYLKAKELGWDESGGPPRLNLVVADAVLSRGEAYENLLAQYQDDPAIQEAIRAIWHSLEHVRELGSLVRVEEEVEDAIRKMKAKEDRDAPLISSARDWEGYKQVLFQRLREVFNVENQSTNLTSRIFGMEGWKSIGLLSLLSRRYDVVCTNPPYMGSLAFGDTLRGFLTTKYPLSSNDLFAAFIDRCVSLISEDGLISMVVQRVYWYTETFFEARKHFFNNAVMKMYADIGQGGFSEISGAAVNICLFIAGKMDSEYSGQYLRVYDRTDKQSMLLDVIKNRPRDRFFIASQRWFVKLPWATLSYWAGDELLEILGSDIVLGKYASAKSGLATGDNPRWTRLWWEVTSFHPEPPGWVPCMSGGDSRSYYTSPNLVVLWGEDGHLLRNFINANGKLKSRPQNTRYYKLEGLTFSKLSSYRVYAKYLPKGFIFLDTSRYLDTSILYRWLILVILNSRLASYLLSFVSPNYSYTSGNIESLPVPPLEELRDDELSKVVQIILRLRVLFEGENITSRDYVYNQLKTTGSFSETIIQEIFDRYLRQCWMHILEGWCELKIVNYYSLSPKTVEHVYEQIGLPVSWYPLVEGYDAIIEALPEMETLPDHIYEALRSHNRIQLSNRELEHLKDRLRAYLSGVPKYAESLNQTKDNSPDPNNNVVVNNFSNFKLSIPPETLVEELSTNLSIHPISVYWLLRELWIVENFKCTLEVNELVQDYLSAKLLAALGFHWPTRQVVEQAGGKITQDSEQIDVDGIIPITPGTGEEVLAKRFSQYLDNIFGAEHGHIVEREIGIFLGLKKHDGWGKHKPITLDRWFKDEFFKRHVSQFKKRPIAWHLTSPKGAFQAIVYYHKFDKDRLKLLRSRYVSETLKELRRQLGEAQNQAALERRALDRAAELEEKIADVEEFDRRLGLLQEGRQREARIWVPWKSPEEQPVGWDPDINDGVRVNIAPVQRLGLLAAEVLSKKDLDSLLAPEGR